MNTPFLNERRVNSQVVVTGLSLSNSGNLGYYSLVEKNPVKLVLMPCMLLFHTHQKKKKKEKEKEKKNKTGVKIS